MILGKSAPNPEKRIEALESKLIRFRKLSSENLKVKSWLRKHFADEPELAESTFYKIREVDPEFALELAYDSLKQLNEKTDPNLKGWSISNGKLVFKNEKKKTLYQKAKAKLEAKAGHVRRQCKKRMPFPKNPTEEEQLVLDKISDWKKRKVKALKGLEESNDIIPDEFYKSVPKIKDLYP